MDNNKTCEGIALDFSNDTTTAYLWSLNPLETTFVTIILPIVTFIGLVGNCAFIFAVVRVPSLRSISVNYYLIALAVVDVIVLLSGLPFYIWPYSSGVSDHTPFSCGAIYFVLLSTVQISALLVTVVAIERYFAVCRPLQYCNQSISRIIQHVVAACVIGIVLGVIVTPVISKNTTFCITWPDLERYENYQSDVQFCLPHYPATFNLFIIIVTFNDIPIIIAFILNVILYWKIIKKLATRKELESTEDTDKIRDQVARMLVVNGCVFFLCQMVPRVLNLGNLINYELQGMWIPPEEYEIIYLILEFVFFVNSAINPYIYSLVSSHYRHAVRQAFIQCRPMERPRRESSSSALSPVTKSTDLAKSSSNLASI